MQKKHSTVLTVFKKYCGPAMLAAAILLPAGNATWADGNSQGNNENGNGAGDDRAVKLISRP